MCLLPIRTYRSQLCSLTSVVVCLVGCGRRGGVGWVCACAPIGAPRVLSEVEVAQIEARLAQSARGEHVDTAVKTLGGVPAALQDSTTGLR